MNKNGMPTISFEQAVEHIRNSQPVIFPTETFFGLGSRALDANASSRVFRAKHRLTAKPLPLILGNFEQIDLVAKIPHGIKPLLDTFWPGPLSVILPAYLRVPDILTGGTGRVAVRISPHPVPTRLALELGEPITASSANISGTPAVVKASELESELVNATAGVLDLPPVPTGGLPSTLVEPMQDGRLRILRKGAIGIDALTTAGYGVVTD